MTTIADVRTSLASAVSTVGLSVVPYIVDQVTPPCAQVIRQAFDPRLNFGETRHVVPFMVRLYGSRAPEDNTQALLESFCELSGGTSLIAAIQNGDNWQATVDYAAVTNVSEVQLMSVAGVEYLVVEIDVEVVW